MLQALHLKQFFRTGQAAPRLAAQLDKPSRPVIRLGCSLTCLNHLLCFCSSLVGLLDPLLGLLQGVAHLVVTEHPLSLNVVESNSAVLLAQPQARSSNQNQPRASRRCLR